SSALLSFPCPAPTRPATHTLSLHDALPILGPREPVDAAERGGRAVLAGGVQRDQGPRRLRRRAVAAADPARLVVRAGVLAPAARSEEHTSELQSRENLVCRLLLEKKKKKQE